MDLELKDKVALVTGGSKGIGYAIAQGLAMEGVKVVICGRGKPALLKAQKEIQNARGQIFTVTGDVTKAADVKRILQFISKKFGQLDIVINNAGGAKKFGDLEKLLDKDWLDTYKLNLMSSVYLARYALPILRKSRSARIIFVSSLSGVQPGKYNPHYTSSKAAVINFSKYLANTLAKERILVNAVCAGPVHSDAWERNIAYLTQLQKKNKEIVRREFENQEALKIPLGRVGEGRDIAGMVIFLASAQASWITGSCFYVDGGKLQSMC